MTKQTEQTEQNKGLLCSILEDKRIGNCSNNGLSENNTQVLLIMEDEEAQVFEEQENIPAVKLVKRSIGGKVYLHVEPVKSIKSGNVGFMAGGSFIYSGDARFRDLVSQYPVALHDREESQELNEVLSK